MITEFSLCHWHIFPISNTVHPTFRNRRFTELAYNLRTKKKMTIMCKHPVNDQSVARMLV